MESLIPILIVLAVVVAIVAVISKKRTLGANIYQRKGELFSAAELRFLTALDQATSPGQRVFGKVRVADLIAIRPGLNPKARQIALNRVAQKHVDFVVCTGAPMTPVCAIELNDSSHASASVKRRDEMLASVCEQAGLPLLVVKAAVSYSPDAIRKQLATALRADSQGA